MSDRRKKCNGCPAAAGRQTIKVLSQVRPSGHSLSPTAPYLSLARVIIGVVTPLINKFPVLARARAGSFARQPLSPND